MKELEEFRKIFWDAFHKPELETDKFRRLWERLEPVNDRVAGPLYSIFSQGHCDYIFRDKQRFPLINQADDFMDYCESVVRHYHEEIMKETVETEEEKKDRQVLLYQTDIKMELSHLAYKILTRDVSPPDKE